IHLVHSALASAVRRRERRRLAAAENVGLRCRRSELETFGNVWLIPAEKPARQGLRRFLQTKWRAGFAARFPPGQTSDAAVNRCGVHRAAEETKRERSPHRLLRRPRLETGGR